jgi:hypothetical protein
MLCWNHMNSLWLVEGQVDVEVSGGAGICVLSLGA